MTIAADCGRFSICYSWTGGRVLNVQRLRIAAASRFATVCAESPGNRSRRFSCGLRPLLDLLQLSLGWSMITFGSGAADCGRFSICYSSVRDAHTGAGSRLRIAAASRFATVRCMVGAVVRPFGCGLRPLLDLLQSSAGKWTGTSKRSCGLRPLLDLLQ